MADLANVLLRSIARAFYPPEAVVIIDAVILHSCLRDDDLAFLVGQQAKVTRKAVNPLAQEGLITIHARPEQRPGQTRSFNRDYYYIDTHRAIDVVKFRVKTIHKMVEKKYGQTVEEKKEYACSICHSAYTQMEVLDDITPTGFRCKRCGNTLDPIEDDGTHGAAGHEVQSRLNQQMAVFEKMLADVDNAMIPEQDFETAMAKAVPVDRDGSTHPGAKSEPVAGGNMPPATVRGLKMESEKIEVSLLDDDERKAEQEEEAKRKAKFAEQNALPSWHTSSTVGMRPAAAGSAVSDALNGVKAEDEDEKKADVSLEDDEKAANNKEMLNSIFSSMMQDSEDEDSDSDDEDEEDEEEEDETEMPPEKKVRISEPSPAKQSSDDDDDEDSS